jgi:hypothetical protein
MKYFMKTGITVTGITGVGTRDARTSEFSNLKTGILETGITGTFRNFKNLPAATYFSRICVKI